MNIKNLLTDTLDFSRKYDIDFDKLIDLIPIPSRENVETNGHDTAVRSERSVSTDQVDATVERKTEPRFERLDRSEPELQPLPLHHPGVLGEVKTYWLSRPEGYTVTTRELYAELGYDMPRRAKSLSMWMSRSPSARIVDLSGGLRLFRRVKRSR